MQVEDYKEVMKTINAIVNNKGVAEVKIENGKRLVVVETNRAVRCSEEIRNGS